MSRPAEDERSARSLREPGAHPVPAGSARSVRPRRADRKSTRLNSSHSSISYAVFCLKKKRFGKIDSRGAAAGVRSYYCRSSAATTELRGRGVSTTPCSRCEDVKFRETCENHHADAYREQPNHIDAGIFF